MSGRKRRASVRLKQDPDEAEDTGPEDAEPSTQRPRRSSSRQPPSAEEQQDRGAAAAAAAAAAAGGGAGRRGSWADGDDGGGGGGGTPPADGGTQRMAPVERVTFDQAEAEAMMQQIRQLDDEANEALDRATNVDIPPPRLENIVAAVVRFVLFRHYEKPGVPIKRQDINDVIHSAGGGRGVRGAKKLPALVLPMAAGQLGQVFGLELRELKRAVGASNEVQTYVLHSMLPTDLRVHFCQHRADDAERGFVTLVLALIQLNNGKMDADELWRHLGQVGLERGDPEEVLGAAFGGRTPDKMIEAMERARYLVSSRQAAPGSDSGQVVVYEWGEAAADEMGEGPHAAGGGLKALVDQWLANMGGGGAQDDAA